MKRLWAALDRSLSLKVFLVCFAIIHLPLAGLLLYLGLGNPADPIPVLVVALLATLLGSLLAFGAVHYFLHPIELLVTAVDRYQEEGVEPYVQVRGSDAVGRLAETMLRLVRVQDATLISLKRQANTDPLTGLGNRRWLNNAVSSEIARAARNDLGVWVIVFDLDHFKAINDAFGHAAGDEVLMTVAETTQRQMRPYDLIARIGGEEFCVVATESGAAFGMIAAERIRLALELGKSDTQTGHLAVTASFGVYRGDPKSETFSEMMRRADELLYLAKAQGRNMVMGN